MWVLVLNPMRGRFEESNPVARAITKEELEAFVARERVEPYSDEGRDHSWSKTFRRGGPLEWFNPPALGDDSMGRGFVDVGTAEDWAVRARMRFEEQILSLPDASNV